MVIIPKEVQSMMSRQKFVVVGSIDLNGMCNLSPRTTFYFSEDVIYWLDFFKHKSHYNFKNVPWISVAVFDKEDLKGYQMKGKVSFVTNEQEKSRITDIICRSTTGKTSAKIFERMTHAEQPELIMFRPHAVYSLNPAEDSGTAIMIDGDSETVSLLGVK
ncbi:MAG: pyridoxamine 5'-phosphate oxidase family protein [Nitrosotalea sp.]